MSGETLCKVEAIERTLSLSLQNVDESPPTSDIQMEDAIEDPLLPASAPQDQTTKTLNLPAVSHAVSGTKEKIHLAYLDIDILDLNGQPANKEFLYDDYSLTGNSTKLYRMRLKLLPEEL